MLGRSCNLTRGFNISLGLLSCPVCCYGCNLGQHHCRRVDIINAIQAAPGAEELDRAMLEHWAV